MVTETMNWKELSDEVGRDFKESHIKERWEATVKANIRKYQSALMGGKTKVYKPVAVKSKRGNTFFVTTVVLKSEYGSRSTLRHYYAMPLFYRNHLWTCIIGFDCEIMYSSFFSNHLFCRYDERFNQKEEITEKFVQRIVEFFFRNGETCAQERVNPKTGEKELFGVYEDGILLGNVIDEVLVFRTYIRFDMMHEDQRESYRELVDDYNKYKDSKRR